MVDIGLVESFKEKTYGVIDMNKLAGFRLIEKTARKFEDMSEKKQNWIKDQAAYTRAIIDAPTEQLVAENKELGKKTLKGIGKGLLFGAGAGALIASGGTGIKRSLGRARIDKYMKNLLKTTRKKTKARAKGQIKSIDMMIKHMKSTTPGRAAAGGAFAGGALGSLLLGGKAEIKAMKDIEKKRGIKVERKWFRRPKLIMSTKAQRKYRNQ